MRRTTIAAAIMLSSIGIANAETFQVPMDVPAGHLNIRTGPGTNFALVGGIPAGAILKSNGKPQCVPRQDGIRGPDWCHLTWNGITGWASLAWMMPITSAPVGSPRGIADPLGIDPVPATRQTPEVYNLTCEAPRVMVGDEAGDRNPVVSVDVSYTPADHSWRVFHHLANGGVVSRSEQYAIVDMTSPNKTQWTGSLNRNRSKKMIAEIKFGSQSGVPYYYEWIYDMSRGGMLEMNSEARCSWADAIQQPTTNAVPVERVAPPVVAMEDRTPQKPIPVMPKKDAVRLYPIQGGNAVALDVLVGGNPVRMLLDTGATMMLLTTDLAAKIVMEKQGSYGRYTSFKMADGRVVKMPTINIEDVRIGSHVLHNVNAGISDEGDLIIPFPVVDSIAPFKIDTRNNELVFDTKVVSN